jgi:tetratricopeptide (TPR) repeat protein
MQLYEKRIKDDPSDIRAWVELGRLEEKHAFFTSAVRRLTTARALGAKEEEIILPLGRSLARLARWDEAFAELNKAVKMLPHSAEAAANLSGAYFRQDDLQGTSRVLQEFVRRHTTPDGRINLSLDDLRRIMVCFSEAKDLAMAMTLAKEIIRVAPDDAGAYAIAGHALLQDEKYAEALPFFEKASRLQPDEAAVAYNYALVLKNTGKEDAAIKQFQRSAGLNRSAVEPFLELAELLEKKKEWKMAAVALSNAANLRKTDGPLLFQAGKVNEKAGMKDEANYWYSQAALASGQYPRALEFAEKLMKSKDPGWRDSGLIAAADANRLLHRMDRYLALMKGASSGGTARDDLRLAAAYLEADLLDKQVELLRRALGKEPRLAPIIHYTIAQTLLKRGLRDEAEKELELAVQGEPTNADYRTQLGSVYYERRASGDRLKKAIEQFREVVKLTPDDAFAYQNLGIALLAAGENGRAAFFLEHALDLEPGYGPSYQELGRAYARMGDREGSEHMLALYRRFLQHDLRLKTLTSKADQNEKDASAQMELGDLLAQTGDLPGALSRFERAVRLRPTDEEARRKRDRVMELLTQKKIASGDAEAATAGSIAGGGSKSGPKTGSSGSAQ